MLYIPRKRKIAQPRFPRVGLIGRLRGLEINGETGAVRRYLNRNIMTRTFLATIPPSYFAARSFYITELGVGSGITAPADTDVDLTTEVDTKAITEPLDNSNLTGATPYSIVTVQFLPGEATGNLTEAGLFLSNGDLVNHALFGRGVPTAATQADPVVITDADHGLTSGDRIRFDAVSGMTQLNFTGANWYYISSLSSSTFSLYHDVALSNTVDGTGFSAFSSGGTWTIVIDKTALNTFFVSFELQAQNA